MANQRMTDRTAPHPRAGLGWAESFALPTQVQCVHACVRAYDTGPSSRFAPFFFLAPKRSGSGSSLVPGRPNGGAAPKDILAWGKSCTFGSGGLLADREGKEG